MGQKREIEDFFQPKSKIAKSEDNNGIEVIKKWWTHEKTAFVGIVGKQVSRSKIAAFDLDDTIITRKSGKKFAVDTHDWKFLYDDIPDKLKDLYNDGYRIVFFTNQNGILKGKVNASDFYKKMEVIIAKLGIPAIVLGAIDKDKYRKPVTGLWELLMKENNQESIDFSASFFVGDAAGRPAGWKAKAKKDFSDTDRKFAANIGIKFYTPDEYFLHEEEAKHSILGFDPSTLPVEAVDYNDLVRKTQELVINVGYPASGKTTFSQRYLIPAGYEHINQDTLKTWQKCVAACTTALAAGKSVVIDNTNGEPSARARYIEVAKKLNVPVRCFHHTASFDLSMHNNIFRSLNGGKSAVPTMVFYTFKKNFKAPSVKEGFTEVVEVAFSPEFKGDKESEALFRSFLY